MENKKKHYKSRFYIIFSILVLIFLTNFASAAIRIKPTLEKGENFIYSYERAEKSDEDLEYKKSRNLMFWTNELFFHFESEANCSILIVNATQRTDYLVGSNITPKMRWDNITTLDLKILYSTFEEMGLEYVNITQDDGTIERVIRLFFIIENEVDESNTFSFRIEDRNELREFMDLAFEQLIYITFFLLGFRLIYHSFEAKKNQEAVKSKIMVNYGLGLIMGGLATLGWEFYHWYRKLNPSDSWEKIFVIEDFPIDLISGTYFTWGTFLCLGFSIMFMSLTVERDVQQRKMPYLTYFLILMQSLILLGLFVLVILPYVLIVWIAVLVLTVINIGVAYLKIIFASTGSVRKKATIILIGIVLTFAVIGLRDFILPNFVPNALGCIFAVVMYKGILLE
jgi:hypothetical protein